MNSATIEHGRVDYDQAPEAIGRQIEFRLLVGRMEGRPIRAEMVSRGVNRYCGTINLGRQFYNPANYYVFIRFTDNSGKKKAIRLHASIVD